MSHDTAIAVLEEAYASAIAKHDAAIAATQPTSN